MIYRSFITSIFNIAKEYEDLFDSSWDEQKFDEISKKFEKDFEKVEITIGLSFFQQPSEANFLSELKPIFKNWLLSLDINMQDANIISNRLKDYFVFALNDIWRKTPDEYAPLAGYFDTPFINASEKIRGWQLYNQWLKKQVNDRMFSEPFGVEKIYVPLRAYYEKEKNDSDDSLRQNKSHADIEKIVFELEKDFIEWANNFSKKTAIRFVSGGPGSGKSTFAKIFAAKIANTTDIPTIYIPLHLFDTKDNLINAMDKFIRESRYLSGNPLDPKTGKNRLLLIFDGLDELAFQGKTAAEVANAFVDEVLRSIPNNNAQNLKHQAIITGRPIAIQSIASKLRQEKQITYVLPYLKKMNDTYTDPNGLLNVDQRDIWWKKYGEMSSKTNYTSMPEDLKRSSLEEITAQPLLNYLVALTYESGQVTFTNDTTLNQIYEGLIREVYQRKYEDGRVTVKELTEDQFIRVLEEIALAMWHGGERQASVSNILGKCKKGGVKNYLERFQEGAKDGVTRLLTAFYFRQSQESNNGDQTFEFTHKSFGEYLTAKRLLRFLERIQVQIDRNTDDPDDGWSIGDSVEKWTEFYAATLIDDDLTRYLKNEFITMDQGTLLSFQNTLNRMISYVINHGFSLNSAFNGANSNEILKKAKNAGEALLGVHCAIAEQTKKVSDLNIKSDSGFGNWITAMRGQRVGPENSIGLKSLAFLRLQYQCFDMQDFWEANLQGSNLRVIRAYAINLGRARLQGANLEGARFQGARLQGANLEGARLEGTIINK